jgi:hypothetical protein
MCNEQARSWGKTGGQLNVMDGNRHFLTIEQGGISINLWDKKVEKFRRTTCVL